MTKYSIQKGKLLEDHIAQTLRDSGLDLRAERSKGSGNGNREKSDINTSLQILDRNVGLEAKNQKTIKIKEWWQQAQKLEVLGREPLLIFKIPNRPFEETLVTMYWQTLVDLLVEKKGVEVAPVVDSTKRRDIEFKTQKAIYAIKELEKALKNEHQNT